MTSSSDKILADWLGDIVALESHVEEVMDHQLKLEPTTSELATTLKSLHDSVRDSKHRAEQFQAHYGTTAGNPLIKTGTEILGKAAGLIDKVRKDSVSKSLRDDAPAFGLLSTSYSMLYTTARALNDTPATEFAAQGLKTYARLTQEVSHALPLAVVEDLKANHDVPTIDDDIVNDVRSVIARSWEATAA